MEPTSRAITAAEVPDLILAAIPSLVEEWPEIEAENADPEGAGGRLGYLDAAWVVRHLADRVLAADTDELEGAFALIEHLIRDGDDYVSELGVIGYLESFHMGTGTSRGLDPSVFRRWLGPLSLRYWDAIIELWENCTPIPQIDPTDGAAKALREGEFVTAGRLTLVSRVGWIEFAAPTFVRAGERYRVDWDASTLVVQRLNGAEHTFQAEPAGPESIR